MLSILSVPLLIAQMWYLAQIAQQLLTVQPVSSAFLLALACCWLARTVLLLVKDDLAQQQSRRLRSDTRQQLLAQLAALGPLRNRFGSDGNLSTLLTEQVDALDGYISRYAPQQILVLVAPLLILLAVAVHSLFAAVLLFVTAPLVPLFMVLVGREASKASQLQLQQLSRMGGRLYDFLQGLPLLKRLNATTIASAHLEHAASQYQQGSMKVLRLAFLSTAVLELFTSVAIALVALYLGLGLLGELPWHKGNIAVPYQSAFFILLLCPEFYQPLRLLGTDYHAKAQAIAACSQFRALYNNGAQVVQSNAAPAFTAASAHSLPPALNLQQIRVGNATEARLTIDQLHISSGEQLLIYGPSGSGKSTLLQLLAGFVPFSGEVVVQGQALDNTHIHKLRSQLGYLQQQAELLPGTIADNLKLANSDAGTEAMQQVLIKVELWDFLAEQEGLDYRLGDFGAGLSGGQQQRLALARLLLQQKPIWLLDEPFAELDEDTAARLSALLQHISKGKTLLLVSHQHSQLSWLSRALRIEQGQLLTDVTLPQDFAVTTTTSPTAKPQTKGLSDG